MRLIDADKLQQDLIDQIDWIRKQDYELYCAIGDDITWCIDKQTTAYDVDKVLKQLEIYSNKDEAEQLGTIPVVELEDAFKIVKGGGIYE